MIPKIKRGNSIPVKFTVMENGEQKDMRGATELTWRIVHAEYGCRRPLALRFEGGLNPYTLVAETTVESLPGVYLLSLSWVENGERRAVDAAAFDLTVDSPGCGCRNPVGAICILADTCIGAAGESAYGIYRRLHPESDLTEEQYAALPIEAAHETAAAVEGMQAATEEAIRNMQTATVQMQTSVVDAIERMQAASEEAIRQMRRAAAMRYEAAGIHYNEATGFYELNGLTDITDEQAEVIYAAGPLREGIRYQYSGNNFSPLLSNPRTNLCYRDWKNSVDLTEKFRGNVVIEVALLESSRARMDTGANSPYYVVLSSASGRLSYCFDACKSLRRVIGILDCSRLANGTDGWGCPVLEEVYLWGVAGNCDLRGAPRLLTASVRYMIRYALPAKAITISLHADVYDAAMADPAIREALEAQPLVALASA